MVMSESSGERNRHAHTVTSSDRPFFALILKKSSSQNGATLVTGRAETGKSALAAEFAAGYERVAWYLIDTAETD